MDDSALDSGPRIHSDPQFHDWVRQLYLAAGAAVAGEAGSLALQRVGDLVRCSVANWKIEDADGTLLAHRSVVQDGHGSTAPERPDPVDCQVAGTAEGIRHLFSFVRTTDLPEFTAGERAVLQSAAHQMVGAEALSNELTLRQARQRAQDRGENGTGFADVLMTGRILSADPTFIALVQIGAFGWNGGQLPFPIEARHLPTSNFTWAHLSIRLEQVGEHLHLSARRRPAAAVLTERESEIAIRMTRGLTFKEIARELGVASSTVSTHAYNLYAKLGIRRRADLVEWLKSRPHGRR